MPRTRVVVLALVALTVFSELIAAAPEATIARGDLLLVRARLRDCPERLRLVEVLRAAEPSTPLLDLGEFTVVGRTTSAVLRDVEAHYRDQMRVGKVPPIRIDAEPADVVREVVLLAQSLEDLDCEAGQDASARDVPRRPLRERIADR